MFPSIDATILNCGKYPVEKYLSQQNAQDF